MGNCCIVDTDRVIKGFDPAVYYTAIFAGILSAAALFAKIKPWWAICIHITILIWLYENNNLRLLPGSVKSRLSGRLYRVSPPLASFMHKHANKILTLVLLFSNTAMVFYLILSLFRKKNTDRSSQKSINLDPAISGCKRAAVLFSGGTDSTNTALHAASKYNAIHLITYDRLGFYNMGGSAVNANKLKWLFKDKNIIHNIINIDRFYKEICYHEYIINLFRHGLILLLTCGLCKLAMHWCTILYCIKNKVEAVYDGSNIEMADPSQNESITNEMKMFYKRFGINLYYPVYYKSRQEREERLYNLGISEKKNVKWTKDSWKIQPFCTQECLCTEYQSYSTFVFYRHNAAAAHEKYEKRMFDFHRQKREFVISKINRYLNKEIPDYSTGRYYEG
jgi:hypothetical protein